MPFAETERLQPLDRIMVKSGLNTPHQFPVAFGQTDQERLDPSPSETNSVRPYHKRFHGSPIWLGPDTLVHVPKRHSASRLAHGSRQPQKEVRDTSPAAVFHPLLDNGQLWS